MLIYYLLLILTPFWTYPKLPTFGGTFTLIKAVGVAALLWAAAHSIISMRGRSMLRRAETRLLLALVALAAISAVTHGSIGMSSTALQSYISMVVFVYVSLVFVNSRRRLMQACSVMIFSMVLASYSVFSGYVKYGARPGGIMGDPNYFGLAATGLLPIAYALHFAAARVGKVIISGVIVLLIGATLISGSRAGVITLAIVLIFALLQSRHKALYLGTTAVLVAALILLLPKTGMDRLFGESESAEISTDLRKQTIRAGLEMVRAEPLFGIGLGMYKPLAEQFNPDIDIAYIAHNTYLELAAELGIPACMMFVAILVLSWRRARRLAAFFTRRRQFRNARMARGFQASIVVFAVGCLFLSAEYTKQLWWLIGMVLALHRVAARSARRRATAVRTRVSERFAEPGPMPIDELSIARPLLNAAPGTRQ